MSRSTKPKRKPSRDQVKAWLGTVLAPMVNSLEVEYDRVSKENWSFRCETRGFEFLWKTEEMLAPIYRSNLEQFWRYYPTLQGRAEAHDAALTKLQAACETAFERTLQSEEFVQITERLPIEKGDRKYLAEYVINGIRDIPSHYSYSDVWNQHSREFLDLRSKPALGGSFSKASQAGEVFRRQVERLLQESKGIQKELADEFQLPPIDPASAGIL